MKTPGTRIAALVGACLLLSQPAFAQRGMQWRGGGGWGPGTAYARLYDPKTVETVSGMVSGVDTLIPMSGMGAGVHLLLATDAGAVSVHVGPVWYLENQEIRLEPGDRVQVRGSRIVFQGKPAVIAAEVTKGQDTLRLRDETGFRSGADGGAASCRSQQLPTWHPGRSAYGGSTTRICPGPVAGSPTRRHRSQAGSPAPRQARSLAGPPKPRSACCARARHSAFRYVHLSRETRLRASGAAPPAPPAPL